MRSEGAGDGVRGGSRGEGDRGSGGLERVGSVEGEGTRRESSRRDLSRGDLSRGEASPDAGLRDAESRGVDARDSEGSRAERRRDRETMLTALGAMRVAGLALYGTWPDTGRELALKADVYAGAVRRRCGSTEFVPGATERWIDRGERFPSAKEFADACAELRAAAYRLVARDVRDAEGRIVLAVVEVRRGASTREIAAAFAARGVSPLPEARVSAEALARLRGGGA